MKGDVIVPKGTYVVFTIGADVSASMPINTVFKQRKDYHYLCPELDIKGSSTNGYTGSQFKSSFWRKATPTEAVAYDANNGPVHIDQCNLFVPPAPWEPTTPEGVREFKKNDYIVFTKGYNPQDCAFPINYVFKQRMDSEHLYPYVDNQDSRSNGWKLRPASCEYDKTHQYYSEWRYATQGEIDRYNREGVPVPRSYKAILPERVDSFDNFNIFDNAVVDELVGRTIEPKSLVIDFGLLPESKPKPKGLKVEWHKPRRTKLNLNFESKVTIDQIERKINPTGLDYRELKGSSKLKYPTLISKVQLKKQNNLFKITLKPK